MTTFVAKRCFVHPTREAAALCIKCTHSFCRECAIEYEGALICASCLAAIRKSSQSQPRPVLTGLFSVPIAFLICWITFYVVGQMLVSANAQTHKMKDTPGAIR